MNVEERVKAKLLSRGFKEEQLLNNIGLIGAVIDETQEIVKNINYNTVLYVVCPDCNGRGYKLRIHDRKIICAKCNGKGHITP